MTQGKQAIKRIRARFGISVAELADLLAVESRTVRRWEDGQQPSPAQDVELLWLAEVANREDAAELGVSALLRMYKPRRVRHHLLCYVFGPAVNWESIEEANVAQRARWASMAAELEEHRAEVRHRTLTTQRDGNGNGEGA